MYIDAEFIIKLGAVIAALSGIGGGVYAVYRWITSPRALCKQHHQELNEMATENAIICYALSTCLDGLMQLGANHNVPKCKEALDKHLNKKAHKVEEILEL